MPTTALSADERRWRAEDDARALAQAEEVKSDPTRHQAAKDAAADMVAKEQERLRGLKKAAGQRVPVPKQQPTGTGSGPILDRAMPPVGGVPKSGTFNANLSGIGGKV